MWSVIPLLLNKRRYDDVNHLKNWFHSVSEGGQLYSWGSSKARVSWIPHRQRWRHHQQSAREWGAGHLSRSKRSWPGSHNDHWEKGGRGKGSVGPGKPDFGVGKCDVQMTQFVTFLCWQCLEQDPLFCITRSSSSSSHLTLSHLLFATCYEFCSRSISHTASQLWSFSMSFAFFEFMKKCISKEGKHFVWQNHPFYLWLEECL